MQESDIKAINRVESLLSFLRVEWGNIFRIVDLVQENQKFFNGKLGGGALKLAADKLESLINIEREAQKNESEDIRERT